MRVDDPTLSMVAFRRRLVSLSGASVSMTVQRPLNSSISAMSLSISGVIVMFLISCMSDIHFHPFISDSYPDSHFYPISPVSLAFRVLFDLISFSMNSRPDRILAVVQNKSGRLGPTSMTYGISQ